jgi:glucokinase
MLSVSSGPAKMPRDYPMDFRGKDVLLGDIGATNARFALLSKGVLGPITNFTVADFPEFADVVRGFFDRESGSVPAQDAVLAVAGPVNDGRCVLTNCAWTIDRHELSRAFGFRNVHLCNDFEALALSLPHLTSADLFRLGDGESVGGAPMAVLGPGTGLGVACLIPRAHEPVVITSEGGHATMAATSAREAAIIDYLRRQFGHVSAERIVSGLGLENLYRAIIAVDGLEVPRRQASDITRAGVAGTCPVSRMALELFCGMLGTIAGNVALTFGARGGVYIAGGIAPRITDFLARSEFRARFENKGRFRAYLQSVPTSVIIHPAATFMGLQTVADRARDAKSELLLRTGSA